MAHTDRLTNTHILIFGGTSGIGFAIANLALASSARITISSSTPSKVDSKVALLRSYYPSLPASHVAGFAVDLLDHVKLEENLTALFEHAVESHRKKVDHVVFTAGDVRNMPTVKDITPERALAGLGVRFVAPAIIAKILATGKYLLLSAESSFTLTGGTNTHRPFPGWAFVAAWGASTEGLMRGLAVDLKPLRVNVVIPGTIQSELLQGMLDQIGEEATEKLKRDNSLTGTFGQPQDIAEAYAWVMRDRFANGALVTSDGGRLLLSPH